MFQDGTTRSAPATSNAIRGTEQKRNLAKQRFARKGGLEAWQGNMGGMIKQVVGIAA